MVDGLKNFYENFVVSVKKKVLIIEIYPSKK